MNNTLKYSMYKCQYFYKEYIRQIILYLSYYKKIKNKKYHIRQAMGETQNGHQL